MIKDKYIGTKSNKFRRIPYIIEYLMKVIDCQEIRRLCRYYTLDPLADEALDYNGVLVKQPDLVDSLENKVIRDKVSKGAEEQILISETFSNTIVNYNRMQICVYPYEITFSERASRYGTSTFGYMTFHIDIIYPAQLNKLGDHMLRAWSIACIIMDAIDDKTVLDEEIHKETGDIKFEFKENMATNYKLASNSDLVILTIPIAVTINGLRSQGAYHE